MGQTNQTTAINSCRVPLNNRIHSRRCFMTGEYCSQLANIQKARERLHTREQCHKISALNNYENEQNKGGEINAFVIMNFSNMSDVAYKWRLQPFIESLTRYLYFEGDELVCYADLEGEKNSSEGQETKKAGEEKVKAKVEGRKDSRRQVSKINVIRADSNYDSNYVICNRVCQQIQMADLIVVDVSSENNNVFYEFGMAVALGKLILPICFSESFFQIVLPDKLKEYVHKKENEIEDEIKETKDKDREYYQLEHLKRHIDCYPWRRSLFEYYGLRYRSQSDTDKMGKVPVVREENKLCVSTSCLTTQYIEFGKVKNSKYGFSDVQYSRFPYVDLKEGPLYIGERVYTKLGNSYNNARYDDNTLIIYTMDGFQNGDQAGRCIVNFHTYMTRQLQKESCFCGDRVGILVESANIPETVKDSKEKRHLLYSVGDVIHLGMNEATYAAQREVIKANDYLTVPSVPNNMETKGNDTLLGFTKDHIRNKSVTIYPRTPVYVKRIAYGLQPDLLYINKDKEPELDKYFCYFHVMLRTLKYVNQLVVDISTNSLESLFWLGAAHGANINAITVQHVESDQERIMLTGSPEKRERAIFDVAGLWSAILHTYDTEGFYLQLKLAQKGIEQRSRLMLQNRGRYEEQLEDILYGDTSEITVPDSDHSKTDQSIENPTVHKIADLINNKRRIECLALESYYRDRFWKPMLSNEHLRIYYHQVDTKDSETGNPKVSVGKWDIDAISVLSHYLSVRSHVGEHSLVSLYTDKPDQEYEGSNFISIGNDAKPLKCDLNQQKGMTLADYILKQYSGHNENHHNIHTFDRITKPAQNDQGCNCFQNSVIQYQGFCNQDHYLYTQIPSPCCYGCVMQSDMADVKDKRHIPAVKCFEIEEKELGEILTGDEIRERLKGQFKDHCYIRATGAHHLQVAQLVLWREVDRKKQRVWYQVSMNGASGPATKALSSLMVNDRHRREVFYPKGERNTWGCGESIPTNPLSELQEKARKEFSETFYSKINENFCASTDLNQTYNELEMYKRQFKHAALLYLSSALYRYFLPFLSLEDEHRLKNGMRYYLASLFASKTIIIQPEKLTEDKNQRESIEKNIKTSLVECTMRAFENVLQGFCGVEALYQVDVLTDNNHENDSRVCVGIEPLSVIESVKMGVKGRLLNRKTNVKQVHCLFLSE